MRHHRMMNLSDYEFRDSVKNKKLIILHPQAPYRNLFLSYFCDPEYDSTLIYYRLNEPQMTLSRFWDNLFDVLQAFSSDFGEKSSKITVENSPAEYAQALAEDLNILSAANHITLYLDECEHLKFDRDSSVFFRELVDQLASSCCLVVNSRIMTQRPWMHAIARGDVAVLGTVHRKSELNFSIEVQGSPQLEVYSFGSGQALIDGINITVWDGALPRNLFFYFMDHEFATRDEIFETFWPLLGDKDATNVFHVTKRKISEFINDLLPEEDTVELTQYVNGFYKPSDSLTRHYDVADFVQIIDEATMTFDDEKQAALYAQAVRIYRMPFLTAIDMPWVLDRREKLQRMYIEALSGLAYFNKRQNQYEESLSYFSRILREAPHREDIHREMMSVYNQLGYREAAIQQYQHLTNLLGDTLGVAPAAETRELFQKLSR